MGFCEMIFHETRSFPAEEKEGLARELRATSIKLLRAITVESVKSPKDFLKALDETVSTQLDILLLLKLSFRLTYINKRAYQTLEEDLKGLESIANNMRNMHGLSPTKWSIHEKVHVQVEPSAGERIPQPDVKAPQKVEKTHKDDRVVKPLGKESRHHKPHHPRRNIPPVSHSMDRSAAKPPVKSVQQVQKSPPHETASASKSPIGEGFEGTPLYNEEKAADKSQESKTPVTEVQEKKSEKTPTESKVSDERKSHLAEQKKSHGKGLWSLRRSTMRQSDKKNPPHDDGGKDK